MSHKDIKLDASSIRTRIMNDIDTTIKLYSGKVILLENTLKVISSNFEDEEAIRSHIEYLINQELANPESADSEFKEDLLLAIHNNRIFPVVFGHVRREFDGFVIDLLCGNYESGLRTLRWILETCIYATEYQSSEIKGSSYVEYVLDLLREGDTPVLVEDKIANDYYFMITKFYARIEVMEKYKPPEFKELLDKIPILKNDKDWHNKDPSVDRSILKNRIRKLYASLSRYSHYSKKSSSSNPRRMMLMGDITSTRFSLPMLGESYRLAIEVLDCILLLFFLLDTWFYGYDSFHAYVKAKKQEFESVLAFINENENLYFHGDVEQDTAFLKGRVSSLDLELAKKVYFPPDFLPLAKNGIMKALSI